MNTSFDQPAKKRISVGLIVVIIVVSAAVVATGIFGFLLLKRSNITLKGIKEGTFLPKPAKIKSEFKCDLANGQLSDFDIAFLKAENTEKNKLYSPLSIKYALKMLEDGSGGTSQEQISAVLGNYSLTKYKPNSNMSLANAFFVKDSFKQNIKPDYPSVLKSKYDAEVFFDPFTSVDRINNWVKSKTLELIPSLLDSADKDKDFILINALAIDMEWNNKFLEPDYDEGFMNNVSYNHVNYYTSCNSSELSSEKFGINKTEVSGMGIFASIDNYDIVSVLGEEKIRQTVENAYRKWIKEKGTDCYGNELTTEAQIDQEIKNYLDEYIKEIKANYTEYGETSSTDFSLYTDNEVKAFAKDLKTYDGTTLQYIGIMPKDKSLVQYIKDADSASLNRVINNMKELKRNNFKDGVITRVQGFIPKFNFDYTLDLNGDLKKIGVTDVFDPKTADLSEMTTYKGAYISKAIHKATIDFTQDGIKAAAATMMGGMGAGGPGFDYIYEVPVEDIDLTFDRPYMFFVRDKSSGEFWFSGTVFEPLEWKNDTTRDQYSY